MVRVLHYILSDQRNVRTLLQFYPLLLSVEQEADKDGITPTSLIYPNRSLGVDFLVKEPSFYYLLYYIAFQ